MKITEIKYYDGAQNKVSRLGMSSLFLELLEILFSTKIFLLEEKYANGAAALRKRIDESFNNSGGWNKTVTGGVDWRKRLKYNESITVNLGVEVQVSARSDLLVRDLVHLRNQLQEGKIDVGVIVVPNNNLHFYLPDRTPRLSDAVRYIEIEFPEAMTYPIIIVGIEHDGPGEALPKQKRKS